MQRNFYLYFSVLNKVSKYRGVNRDKNELNAAFWFTQPGKLIFLEAASHFEQLVALIFWCSGVSKLDSLLWHVSLLVVCYR